MFKFKVFTLVCLFVIRLRFPPRKSVANIKGERYGDATLKDIRRLEKFDFKKRKIQLDINFLETCKDAGVVPHFLQFKTANGHLRSSTTYNNCQSLLLDEEIRSKRKTLSNLETPFQNSKNGLHGILSYFDFLHIISLFLDKNTSTLESIELRQNVKLAKLLEENVSHDPKKIIHNISSHELALSIQ